MTAGWEKRKVGMRSPRMPDMQIPGKTMERGKDKRRM